MPSKSRKNRRYNPQTRKVQSSTGILPTQSTSQAGTVQTERMASVYAPKAPAELVPTGGFLSHELKWIGIVTAIIVILLVAAFYLFH